MERQLCGAGDIGLAGSCEFSEDLTVDRSGESHLSIHLCDFCHQFGHSPKVTSSHTA
jgi:hypothetical protein